MAVAPQVPSRPGGPAPGSVAAASVRAVPRSIRLLPLVTGVVAWTVHQRREQRRLRALLADERALTATLINRVRELDLIVEASRAMNSSLRLEQTLGVILDAACSLLRADEGSVQLVCDDAPDQLEVVAVHGTTSARLGQRRAIGEGLAGRVAHSAQPLVVEGPHSRSATAARFGSALVVPLRYRDELVGVLNVAVTAGNAPFSDLDVRSATVFAETAAAAICNARLLQATRDSVAALTELDRLKDDFLTLVTHELRTPLTSVIGLAQTIARSADRLGRGRIAELARLIGTEGWRLNRLVDDLLRTSQLQQGRFVLHLQQTDVAALVRDAVASLAASSATHHLEIDAPPILEWKLDGDGFSRIVVNLVGNALAYTPPGSTIKVTLTSKGTLLRLEVEDDGPGIPAAEHDSVFEKFRRGGNDDSGGGLGLGLYLVRTLARAHGGDVTLVPRDGGGCRFTVTMPARTPDSPSSCSSACPSAPDRRRTDDPDASRSVRR